MVYEDDEQLFPFDYPVHHQHQHQHQQIEDYQKMAPVDEEAPIKFHQFGYYPTTETSESTSCAPRCAQQLPSRYTQCQSPRSTAAHRSQLQQQPPRFPYTDHFMDPVLDAWAFALPIRDAKNSEPIKTETAKDDREARLKEYNEYYDPSVPRRRRKKRKCVDASTPLLPFPKLLYRMLLETRQDQQLHKIVSWQSNGRAFEIHNTFDFERIVMPRYFAHQTFFMFQKKMRQYQFRRIQMSTTVVDGHTADHGCCGAYFHEYFLLGRPDLAKMIHPSRRDDNADHNCMIVAPHGLLDQHSLYACREMHISELLNLCQSNSTAAQLVKLLD